MGVPRSALLVPRADSSTRSVRAVMILRAGIIALGVSLHVLAGVIAFVVYGINHSLDPATIFVSLTLFNMLRMPMMFLRECSPFVRFVYRV